MEKRKIGRYWNSDIKQENLQKLDAGTTGFFAVGDKMEKPTRYNVGGAWNMLGMNEKVVNKKKEPKPKKDFMIYVRTPKSETFPLKIPSTTKISKVKDKIKAKKEIPVEDQRLFFNKEPLVDSKTLKDSGVKNGDTIDLDPMKIYVKNPKGKRFTLDVDPAENIRDIMDMVETKEGTPVNQQILHFL